MTLPSDLSEPQFSQLSGDVDSCPAGLLKGEVDKLSRRPSATCQMGEDFRTS